MYAIGGVGAARPAPAMGNLRPGTMHSRRISAHLLGPRFNDGTWPIRSHRTCAELIAAGEM